MGTEESYLTKEGEAELLKELRELKEMRRPAMAKKLKDAAAQGDLKENADYHDAKERLGFIEGRVQHIESILRDATVIENAGPSDIVQIGSTVIIREHGEVDDEEYKIVGSAEANPRQRKISQKSPIGSALLGKRPGETVKVKTPDGTTRLKIVAVR